MDKTPSYSNVLFINTLYYPDRYEAIRLERLQEEITFTVRHIAYRSICEEDFKIQKQAFHNKLKGNLYVIDCPKRNDEKIKATN